MAEYQKNPDEMGCLWEKSSARGETFMTGIVEVGSEKIPVVLFRTKEKKSEKSPDWRILKSKPKEDTGAKKMPVPPPPKVEKEPRDYSDIPF